MPELSPATKAQWIELSNDLRKLKWLMTEAAEAIDRAQTDDEGSYDTDHALSWLANRLRDACTTEFDLWSENTPPGNGCFNMVKLAQSCIALIEWQALAQTVLDRYQEEKTN